MLKADVFLRLFFSFIIGFDLKFNIIKGILKSMTSIWKDIFHTLSSTVGDMAEQKQVKQGVLLMKVLVEKAAGDKMS